MASSFFHLRINKNRFHQNLEALARIGKTSDGGVHRPAFSADHLAARKWFCDQARKAGLTVVIDGAGNRIARLESADPSAKTLVVGSHLDSVPHGGRFDGALGVLCALEVLETLKDNGPSLKVNLEAVDFTDEEGAYVGLLGSRAFTGDLTKNDFKENWQAQTPADDILARDGLTRKGVLAASRIPGSIAGYLEVHVEQGARLFQSRTPVGIVTDIVGIARIRLGFKGKADHAGTALMKDRKDALMGASSFACAAWDMVVSRFPDSVVNIGAMEVKPGAFNVVPETAELSLEFRSPDTPQLKALEKALMAQARASADLFRLTLEIEHLESVSPVSMSKKVQKAIKKAADLNGLTSMHLVSGAGHDAQSFAPICPAGMIFVPSVNGISHSPEEFTRPEDCVNGANVLLHSVLAMAKL